MAEQNQCPECKSTMVVSEQGTKLTCTNSECKYEIGFDPETRGQITPGEKPKPKEGESPTPKNEDTITT